MQNSSDIYLFKHMYMCLVVYLHTIILNRPRS